MSEINGSYESITFRGDGVRYVRMKPLQRVRLWILRKLGGVDRDSVRGFAEGYLQPNGRAVHTLMADGAMLRNERIVMSGDQIGVAIAPWVREVTIVGCTFLDGEEAKDRLETGSA